MNHPLFAEALAAYSAGTLIDFARAHLPCPDPMNVSERDENEHAMNQARYFPDQYLANLTPDGWRGDGAWRRAPAAK